MHRLPVTLQVSDLTLELTLSTSHVFYPLPKELVLGIDHLCVFSTMLSLPILLEALLSIEILHFLDLCF